MGIHKIHQLNLSSFVPSFTFFSGALYFLEVLRLSDKPSPRLFLRDPVHPLFGDCKSPLLSLIKGQSDHFAPFLYLLDIFTHSLYTIGYLVPSSVVRTRTRFHPVCSKEHHRFTLEATISSQWKPLKPFPSTERPHLSAGKKTQT